MMRFVQVALSGVTGILFAVLLTIVFKPQPVVAFTIGFVCSAGFIWFFGNRNAPKP